MTADILQGDCRDVLKTLADESVQCCITSPPYWNQRDYNVAGQIGLEATPEAYVEALVSVFREVRRVLRKDGTVWLNLGDSYAGSWGNQGRKAERGMQRPVNGAMIQNLEPYPEKRSNTGTIPKDSVLKRKDLIGIPWRVAFALQADGWWLRSDIVWAKTAAMPESVTDRPTRAHEYVFLLAKSEHYYYDAVAIREPAKESSIARINQPNFANQTGGEKDYANGTNPNRSMRQTLENWAEKTDKQRGHSRKHAGFNDRWDSMSREEQSALGANKRDVWVLGPESTTMAHWAVMPTKLVEPCILAGSAVGDTVLDPFAGSGTVARVATKHRRHSISIELNPDYCQLITKRLNVQVTLPLEATEDEVSA